MALAHPRAGGMIVLHRRHVPLTLLVLCPLASAQVAESWTLGIAPSPYRDFVAASVTDASGAMTVAGTTQTDSGEFTAYPSSAGYVARVDPQGAQQWYSALAPQPGWRTSFSGLAAGPASSYYAVGSTATTDSPSAGDLVLARYAADGTELWALRHDTGQDEYGLAVAADPSGDAWVCGQVSVGSPAATDVLLLRVSPAGSIVFARSWNGAANASDSGLAILADGVGGAYLTGTTDDTATDSSVLLARFDGAGNELWARTLSGGTARGHDLDLDASGNVLVTGRLAPPNVVTRPFLAKYDPNGNLLWQRFINDADHGGGYGRRVVVDPAGDIVVAGAWGFEPTHLDGFVRKYGPTGNVRWTHNFAGPGAKDTLDALAVDAAGEIAVAGTSAPTGQTAVTDALVVRLAPDGRRLWERTYGPAGSSDWGVGVGFGPVGSVLFTGVVATAGQHVLVARLEDSAVPFCFGDGSGAACPCGNVSSPAARAGCTHSLGQAGTLRAIGVASLSADALVLEGSAMPNSSALYFQGTTQQAGGAGAPFGDGLRCAGGTMTRLTTALNASGASQFPGAGDPAVSVRGLVGAPGTRTYQIWYRNAASFCTPDTFNLTNGVLVTWVP
ncbi:MAG: hypothetical protein JNK02_11255 [Planctomycetes bacterium]|nr:hypothetical protein [Planctomycetota bacterium]